MRPAPLLASKAYAALLVLLLVLAAPMACAKSPPEAHSAPTASPAAGDKAGAAAGGTTADDTALPPGIDVSKLDELAKKIFFRVVNSEASICGKAQSLLASAKTDASCRRSLNAVRYAAQLASRGFTQSEIVDGLDKRYRTVEVKHIDVADAPVEGNPSAKVTLVEFADYECPHCKRFQPVLRQILDEFKGEVRVYFKHYPLPQHPSARVAAEAAVAAQRQGKFWPFQDKLWENQDSLNPADMEKYAKQVGLDVPKFRADMDDPKVKAHVQKDLVDGKTLGLSSTPTLYIDGREYTDAKDTDSLREWIKEEIGR